MDTETLKGFLDIAVDTEYKRKLAAILHDGNKVRSDELPFIRRVSELLRRFTVAEAAALDVIFSRYKPESKNDNKKDDDRWES